MIDYLSIGLIVVFVAALLVVGFVMDHDEDAE